MNARGRRRARRLTGIAAGDAVMVLRTSGANMWEAATYVERHPEMRAWHRVELAADSPFYAVTNCGREYHTHRIIVPTRRLRRASQRDA